MGEKPQQNSVILRFTNLKPEVIAFNKKMELNQIGIFY
jgi:hypothetical protein